MDTTTPEWTAFHRIAAHADLIERAAALLRAGGVVAFPTETVYGLGADALNPDAVARVFEIKRRPRFDPLIVHVDGFDRLRTLVARVPDTALSLARHFWPGPLTLVLPRSALVPDLVTAGLPTVAVRMPRHPVARELIRRADRPLAAPSANPFGFTSPTCAAHVREQLGPAIDLILDGGPCEVGIESTIVRVEEEGLTLLRPGGIPREEIERVAGPLREAPPVDDRPEAPGRLARHYATRTPLRFGRPAAPPAAEEKAGLLAFRAPADAAGYAAVEVLSHAGDLREAAAHLFAAMRRLDALGLNRIDAEPAPGHGLGAAINDRLRRAAAR